MKANELRIGNYILENFIQKDGGFKYELCVVDARIIHYAEHFGNEWSGKPVPLSEEWLLKFGFKYVGVDGDGDGLFSDGSEVWIANIDEGFYLHEYGKQIEFVHQLQNLYFALTGNELTIQP